MTGENNKPRPANYQFGAASNNDFAIASLKMKSVIEQIESRVKRKPVHRATRKPVLPVRRKPVSISSNASEEEEEESPPKPPAKSLEPLEPERTEKTSSEIIKSKPLSKSQQKRSKRYSQQAESTLNTNKNLPEIVISGEEHFSSLFDESQSLNTKDSPEATLRNGSLIAPEPTELDVKEAESVGDPEILAREHTSNSRDLGDSSTTEHEIASSLILTGEREVDAASDLPEPEGETHDSKIALTHKTLNTEEGESAHSEATNPHDAESFSPENEKTELSQIELEGLNQRLEKFSFLKGILDNREAEVLRLRKMQSHLGRDRLALLAITAAQDDTIQKLCEEISGYKQQQGDNNSKPKKGTDLDALESRTQQFKDEQRKIQEQAPSTSQSLKGKASLGWEDEKRELLAEMKHLNDTLEVLKSQQVVSAEFVRSSREESEALDKRLRKVTARCEELETEATLAKQELASEAQVSDPQLDEVKETLQNHLQENVALQQKVLELEASSLDTTNELNATLKENSCLKEEILELKTKLTETEANLEASTTAHNVLTTRHQESQLQFNDLIELKLHLETDLNETKAEVDRLKSQLETTAMASPSSDSSSATSDATVQSPYRSSMASMSSVSLMESPLAQSPLVNVPYIRNVLLGFLQHKTQRKQLMPVVSVILDLSPSDQDKFWSALT